MVIQLKGKKQFLQFGCIGPVFALEQIFGRLLGKGAAALDNPAGPDICQQRPEHACDIHPEMGKK